MEEPMPGEMTAPAYDPQAETDATVVEDDGAEDYAPADDTAPVDDAAPVAEEPVAGDLFGLPELPVDDSAEEPLEAAPVDDGLPAAPTSGGKVSRGFNADVDNSDCTSEYGLYEGDERRHRRKSKVSAKEKCGQERRENRRPRRHSRRPRKH
jgi:hypothetical protein